MTKYKSCVACTQLIHRNMIVCNTCYAVYYQYKNEPWFRELAKLQHRQDVIDMFESGKIPYSARTNLYGTNVTAPSLPIRNKNGRPGLNPVIIQRVLDIYDNGKEQELSGASKLSNRAIMRKMKEVHNTNISLGMVWNIIKKYRAVKH